MPSFYYIQPEVAGGIGPSTEFDPSVYPPEVTNLEYEFADWLGDAILESFPCFIVTKQLADELRNSGLTGFEFGGVVVTKSLEFDNWFDIDKYGPLPDFERLQISGNACVDDMGLEILRGGPWHCNFIVSEHVLALFRKFGFRQGEVLSTIEV